MTTRRHFSVWVTTVVAAVCLAGWAQAEDKPVEPSTDRTETNEQTAVEIERPKGLSSAQVAAWLILQHHREVEVSKWAAEHASSEQVKMFAQEMAAQHGKMIAKLHAAGLVEKKSAEAEVGEVLQQLAHRVEQRLSDPDNRIELGFRGGEQRDAATDRRDERQNDRKQLGKEREEVRDTRQRVREAGRDDAKNDEGTEKTQRGDVRDERRELRDERADSRENRREATAEERRANVRNFIREAMPFVRENLPEIMEVVGKSIETAAERDSRSGWIDFQRQVAQKHIQSVKNQLQKQSGRDFDEAFIAYQVGAHMQMINTLEVAQNYLTSDMRATVDQMLATTKEHQTHAQQLMQKLEDPNTRSEK